MWEKKSDDGGIHDKDNPYTSGMTSSPYTLNGTMVTTRNGGGGFAGHTDWRIPTVNELQGIVNYQNVFPSTYSAFNTSCAATCTVTTCSCTQSSFHWSSSIYQFNSDDAWGVSVNDGFVNDDGKNFSRYVRAVRGGT